MIGTSFALLTSLTCLALAEPSVPTPSEMGRSVAPLVSAVKDSVVTIQSIKVIPRAERADPLSQFLQERFGMGQPRGGREERQQQGLGSGFIIDGKGIILTNNHVVAGADQVQVVTSDGRSLPAVVVGSDPGTDVAVVRLTKPPSNLKVAKLGNSDAVRVGDYVLAIGNPLGLGQTVTMGIVSAKNRTLDGRLIDYADFIQTDAAINQGNSGGPLFNFAGDVVGINSAILNPARAMNVGFAIPINQAKSIADQILRNGRVGRGYLGISSVPLTPELARQVGVEFEPGALVGVVERGSPADAAGLKANDVVVEIAGRRIDSGRALTQVVRSRQPGETVPMTLVRGRQRLNVQVKLTENERLRQEDVLGMAVQLINEQEAATLGLPAGAGLRVISVNPRGPVSGSLAEGDIIVMIAAPTRTPATVASLRKFEQTLQRGARGQLIILRDGEPFALTF
ncbi:MAG TPA: trypsin-like peptidase domain-containing protein [Polyangia bacterium]